MTVDRLIFQYRNNRPCFGLLRWALLRDSGNTKCIFDWAALQMSVQRSAEVWCEVFKFGNSLGWHWRGYRRTISSVVEAVHFRALVYTRSRKRCTSVWHLSKISVLRNTPCPTIGDDDNTKSGNDLHLLNQTFSTQVRAQLQHTSRSNMFHIFVL